MVHQGCPDSQGPQGSKESRVLEVSEDLLVFLEPQAILVSLVLKGLLDCLVNKVREGQTDFQDRKVNRLHQEILAILEPWDRLASLALKESVAVQELQGRKEILVHRDLQVIKDQAAQQVLKGKLEQQDLWDQREIRASKDPKDSQDNRVLRVSREKQVLQALQDQKLRRVVLEFRAHRDPQVPQDHPGPLACLDHLEWKDLMAKMENQV